MEMTRLAWRGGTGLGGICRAAAAWAAAAYVGFCLGGAGAALALALPPVTLLLAKGPGFPLGSLGPACLVAVPDTAIGAEGSAVATRGAARGGTGVGEGLTGTKGVPGLLSSSAMASSMRSEEGGEWEWGEF